MPFTIVSERQGITSRDSRGTPQEALVLASALVQSGVEKIWVYDDVGRFVSASALSQIARQSVARDEPAAPTANPDTTDLLACDGGPSPSTPKVEVVAPAPTAPDTTLPTRKGPRIFRMAPQRN